MQNSGRNTRRIANNTLMLYLRMGVGLLVSLYTSRVVLETLGVENYGIYNAVAGLVTMFSLVSGAMSVAVSRHLEFELGRQCSDQLKRVFSTSLIIHAALALVVVALAETAGSWFLNSQMTIPPPRLPAANGVFQCSLLSFAIGVCGVPYHADIVAHERMGIFACIGLLEIVLKLAAVLWLGHASTQDDKLILYSLLLLAISAAVQATYAIYCRKKFAECSGRPSLDRGCLRELLSFSGWNLLGNASHVIKGQGVNLLLNVFCGPIVNAANGVATTVFATVNKFAWDFMTAVSPQITKSYAANDRAYAFSLVKRSSRFSFYIILLLSLPLMIETAFVLNLWLKDVPPRSVAFVRLMLADSLVGVLSISLVTLQYASGKIRRYNAVIASIELLSVLATLFFLKRGYAPECAFVVTIAATTVCLLYRIVCACNCCRLSVWGYFSDVLANVALVALLSSPVPLLVYSTLSDGTARFLFVTLAAAASVALASIYAGCTTGERKFILERVAQIVRRVRWRFIAKSQRV